MASRDRTGQSHPRQCSLEDLLRLGATGVAAAVREDLAGGDPTSDALFGEADTARAVLVARAPGVIAGLPVAERVFHAVDERIRFAPHVDDGERVEEGDTLAEITGPSRSILAAERTALNFLQRMSGIATLAARYARRIATTDTALLDTRKTAPGLRALDKYAVRVGGGRNHRLSLSDLGMIKDTHIAAVGGIAPALEAARTSSPELPLEVEVRSFDELDAVLSTEPLPERILLDNLSPDALRTAVQRIGGRAIAEASGGVTLETIRSIAETGVDAISVGELTHSVRALDVAMEVRSSEDDEPIADRIARVRERLGSHVVLLVHHYMRDAIVEHADIVGDSLALARAATEQDAEIILFCGVSFMGETAAIVCRKDQEVLMPVPEAGCFLADCADLPSIDSAWTALGERIDTAEITPVTYVNSSAELKAFCGRNNGIACTSANAATVVRQGLDRSQRVFFFPDRHLGTNAAIEAGVAEDEILVWPPPSLDPDPRSLDRARVIVWPGACNVHRRFRSEHVDRIRALYPDASIVVHPECARDVVELADRSGSTAQILTFVDAADDGVAIAIGTEARLVRRLQRRHPGKRILHLAEVPPFCRTMSRTTPQDLLETLQEIEAGAFERRRITVDGETATRARAAFERMLQI